MLFRVFTILLIFLFGCKKLDIIPNTTLPVVVEADSITFAVIGDFGDAGEPAFKVSEMVKSWNPAFIITLGDNNYAKGELSK